MWIRSSRGSEIGGEEAGGERRTAVGVKDSYLSSVRSMRAFFQAGGLEPAV